MTGLSVKSYGSVRVCVEASAELSGRLPAPHPRRVAPGGAWLYISRMDSSPITWTRDEIAAVPLRRFTARSGAVDVGYVEYDGGNRMWVWASPLAEDAWGWGADEAGAKQGLEAWLKTWLENFRPFFAPG